MSLLFTNVSLSHRYVCDVCNKRKMQNKKDEKVQENWGQVSCLFNAIQLKFFDSFCEYSCVAQGMRSLLVGFLSGSVVKNLPVMQETRVWSLGQEDTLEKEIETHFSVLAWEIPWTEEPSGLYTKGCNLELQPSWATWGHKRVRHELAPK